jgi:integrase/recombinase XerD
MKTLTAIQSFLYNRLSLNRRPKTIKWYRQNLNRFANFYPDELPTEPEAIEQFLAQVTPSEKDETRHGYYRTLRALYRFICRRHRLANPMDLIDAPKRRKKVQPTLTTQELYRLLSIAESHRDKAIISLFIDNGARVGEVASLKKGNIFEDFIRVQGKTGERDIPISEECRRLLLTLVASGSDSEYVFSGQRGPLTAEGIYRIIHKYMNRANISGPKRGPHRIRHAFGKHYIRNGGDTRSLQKIMGHASISTTEMYVELASEEITAKHHQFTPLRSTYAAAQGSLFKDELDASKAVKEAEAILKGKPKA